MPTALPLKIRSENFMTEIKKPYILAPAGDQNSFLAAIAAGADAIYCGLKIFSARMEAENFGIEELTRLTELADSRGIKVYIAFNSIIKQGELEKVVRILKKITRYVHPHALIVQDIGIIPLARKAGFKGKLHLSTLGNCCFTKGLDSVKKAGFSRVVLPRELNIDEIKAMAEKTPKGLELEVFVHGALCYGVSGRCYWSSWFGGKSGLRGRCVQPCRRIYTQNINKQRFFSCLDLSVDVLVKVLKEIPEVTCWKIEGRKKSPHYVFYTVKAYKMLRDHGNEPDKKKTALAFLNYALGRPVTHYNFLPQRPQNPLKKDVETGSGLFVGRVKLGTKPYFITREPLFTNDLLRIGYEDDKGHAIQRVTMPVPKKGKLVLKQRKDGIQRSAGGKIYKNDKKKFQKGTPVFIVDRREKDIALLIKELARKLEEIKIPKVMPLETGLHTVLKPKNKKWKPANNALEYDIDLCENFQKSGYSRRKTKYQGHNLGQTGLWISNKNIQKVPVKSFKNIWWWLPPVIWPGKDEQAYYNIINKILSKGGRYFVVNIPWQISLFNKLTTEISNKTGRIKGLSLWAGPFCNITNSACISALKNMGFSGAIVSPELDQETFLSLPGASPLPLGAVVEGNWPLAISRIISEDIQLDSSFSSPMGETCYVSQKDENYWIFPGWRLDLTSKKQEMRTAGYLYFVNMEGKVAKGITMKNRPGLWNWKLRLL